MKVTVVKRRHIVKGVIYGVCDEISEFEIKENVKGGTVTDMKRFKAGRVETLMPHF